MVIFTGIVTLLNRINKPNITVAVDGSLYRYHPKFHAFMMEKIQNLINPGLKVSFKEKITFVKMVVIHACLKMLIKHMSRSLLRFYIGSILI